MKKIFILLSVLVSIYPCVYGPLGPYLTPENKEILSVWPIAFFLTLFILTFKIGKYWRTLIVRPVSLLLAALVAVVPYVGYCAIVAPALYLALTASLYMDDRKTHLHTHLP
ncbi:MAG: hypothetical protein V4736_13265 [Bdellovibrionota bacterium]